MKRHKYSPDSAGALVYHAPITVTGDETVASTIERIREHLSTTENDLQYVFVLDKDSKLKGVIALSDLFLLSGERSVSEVMNTSFTAVRPETDKEVMAVTALRSDMYSMPVVDGNGIFVGVVPTHTIFTVLSEEHSEDLLYVEGIQDGRSAGVILKHSVWRSTLSRLPWLLIGLVGGIFAAMVVGKFESILNTYIILTFFLPLVVYMSDAVAGQTLAILIRAIALDHSFSKMQYAAREIGTGVTLALITSASLFFLSWTWLGELEIALVLGVALFLSVIVAVVVALSMTFLLVAVRKDPAVGSGPFATIIIDLVTIVIYLFVATILLESVAFSI